MTPKIRAAQHREVQVAAAVAREAVVQLHVDHALELIRHAASAVRELPLLDIYLRLLGLSGAPGEVVTNRVLAALGHTPRTADTSDTLPAAPYGEPSLLQRIRRRLRGRVNLELRRTVELRTAVVKVALLDLHVTHARGFVALLSPTQSASEACEAYTALVPMPAPHAAVLYMLVLDRLAAEEAPAAWPATAESRAPAPLEPRLPRPERRPARTRSSA